MSEWIPISGFESKYAVNAAGDVKNLRTGKILKPRLSTRGYLNVALSVSKYAVKVRCPHILVAEAFIGPRPQGQQVNHKDGIKTNNHLDNLEYVTPSRNRMHAIELGLVQTPKGLSHHRSKLTADQVWWIRAQKGVSASHLAKELQVSPSCVLHARTGRTYAEI